MKRLSFKLISKTVFVCCLISTVSCKKMFDVKPVDQVDAANAYQSVNDANAAVLGIYGQLLTIADRYVVLNELRADLMSPTANADIYLKQLNTHTETTDNPWADPKPWYKIILNCNDALYHFDDMLKTGKLKPIDYQQRYSDVGMMRCWLYLQLAMQYGTIPYVTDPLTNLTDLIDATKFPRLTMDQLLPKLAAFVNDPARYLDNYATSDPITGSTSSALNTSIQDAAIYNSTGNSAQLLIPKYAIAADINLWAGNYRQAFVDYKYLAEFGAQRGGYTDAAAAKYEQYKVAGTSAISFSSSGTLNDAIINTWREIFSSPTGQSGTNTSFEWLWRIPFNPIDNTDPFVDLFANTGSAKYLLTASKAIINNWNTQVSASGYPSDGRAQISVRTVNGQPVIAKYLEYYWNTSTFQPVNALQKGGVWLLYRTAALQNHMAEAILNDVAVASAPYNQNRIAYALYDRGIRYMFNPVSPNIPGGTVDVTNTEQTNVAPFNYQPPYDFDARSGGPQNYHFDWYRQVGTRNRAGLINTPLSLINNPIALQDSILQENARELAFEGYRWGDLVRYARRRGDPSILANKVADKLKLEGNGSSETVRARLMDPNNWFMPFKL